MSQSPWQSPWKRWPKQYCSSVRYEFLSITVWKMQGWCISGYGVAAHSSEENVPAGQQRKCNQRWEQVQVTGSQSSFLAPSSVHILTRTEFQWSILEPIYSLCFQKIFYHGGVGYSPAQKVIFNYYKKIILIGRIIETIETPALARAALSF